MAIVTSVREGRLFLRKYFCVNIVLNQELFALQQSIEESPGMATLKPKSVETSNEELLPRRRITACELMAGVEVVRQAYQGQLGLSHFNQLRVHF